VSKDLYADLVEAAKRVRARCQSMRLDLDAAAALDDLQSALARVQAQQADEGWCAETLKKAIRENVKLKWAGTPMYLEFVEASLDAAVEAFRAAAPPPARPEGYQ
jgi:hypothetical protein